MRTDLCFEALENAVMWHRPPKDLINHSDQGTDISIFIMDKFYFTLMLLLCTIYLLSFINYGNICYVLLIFLFFFLPDVLPHGTIYTGGIYRELRVAMEVYDRHACKEANRDKE